jgi:hypothetical protein
VLGVYLLFGEERRFELKDKTCSFYTATYWR